MTTVPPPAVALGSPPHDVINMAAAKNAAVAAARLRHQSEGKLAAAADGEELRAWMVIECPDSLAFASKSIVSIRATVIRWCGGTRR